MDGGDSEAIWGAFKDYTETALRVELEQDERSGRNDATFSEEGINFRFHS